LLHRGRLRGDWAFCGGARGQPVSGKGAVPCKGGATRGQSVARITPGGFAMLSMLVSAGTEARRTLRFGGYPCGSRCLERVHIGRLRPGRPVRAHEGCSKPFAACAARALLARAAGAARQACSTRESALQLRRYGCTSKFGCSAQIDSGAFFAIGGKQAESVQTAQSRRAVRAEDGR
jgi:hypothetical protein